MHLKTWDENMMYIQQYYKQLVHTSTDKSHFETCFGYLMPYPLDIVYGQQRGVREDTRGEALKLEKFVKNIMHIHLQVHETLKSSQERYKAQHDQEKIEK
jgi:hypothetical protein